MTREDRKKFVRLKALLARKEEEAAHLQRKQETKKKIRTIAVHYVAPILGVALILFFVYLVVAK